MATAQKELEQIPLEFQLGTPSIGLGTDFSPANAREYLDWYVDNGLIEKGGLAQIIEVLAAPSPDVDLGDRKNKSFLKAYEGLNEIFEEYRTKGYDFEPVVLAFFKDCGAHMVSNVKWKRERAEKYLKSCVDIGKKIGAKRVIGPFAAEHQNFDPNFNILNAAPHLLEVSRYITEDLQDNEFEIAFEVLRSEESVLHTVKQAKDIIAKVKQLGEEKYGLDITNVGLQGDLSHAMAEAYPSLAPHHTIEERYKDLGKYIDDTRKILKYLHLSRYEKWMSANNRGKLTKGDKVGSQLQKVYERLLRYGLKIPTTVEVPHYLFKDALGRNSPRLNAMQEPQLTIEARKDTLSSYRLAQREQRAAIKARRAG